MLYGCENWILTEQLISCLETLQGELAKRILKQPKWASNTAPNVVMGWTTVRARVVVRSWASFTSWCLLGESVGSRALVSMGDDVEALHLVKECRELEMAFGTKFTEDLLKDGRGGVSERQLKEIIFKVGRESHVASCAKTGKVPLVAKIAQAVGWEVVWGAALSMGVRQSGNCNYL